MSDPILNRRGYVEVSAEAAKASPSILLRLQQQMAITDISINYATDVFKCYGCSPLFDEIEGHQLAPRYDWHLGPNNTVTYKRSTR